MKKYFLIFAFAFPVVLHAQGPNSNFILPDSCNDCDEVKSAIKASSSKSSSYNIHSWKPLGAGQWLKKFYAKKKTKIKKAFSRHKKVRTDYEACFYRFAKKN